MYTTRQLNHSVIEFAKKKQKLPSLLKSNERYGATAIVKRSPYWAKVFEQWNLVWNWWKNIPPSVTYRKRISEYANTAKSTHTLYKYISGQKRMSVFLLLHLGTHSRMRSPLTFFWSIDRYTSHCWTHQWQHRRTVRAGRKTGINGIEIEKKIKDHVLIGKRMRFDVLFVQTFRV